MGGISMAKHKLLRQRINKEAWELKEFSARELQYKINNYANMDGRNRTKNLQVTIQRLCNLLKQNKNIKFIPDVNNDKRPGMWKWVGDEK
jgi:hypothetical protein